VRDKRRGNSYNEMKETMTKEKLVGSSARNKE